ncbi:Zinc finger C2H2 superfamily [Sergentomyia squamirostris]
MDNSPFLVKQELEELCRICETTENLIDISTEEFSHLNEKLHILSDFAGDYTYWLRFICASCISKLEIAFDFKVQSEETYKKIISRIQNNVYEDNNSFSSFPNFKDSECEPVNESSEIDIENEKKYFELLNMIRVADNVDSPDIKQPTDEIEQDINQDDSLQFIEKQIIPEMGNDGNESKGRSKEVFKCKICGKIFTSKHNARDHIEGVHMKRMKYECDICRAKFCLSSTLYRHKEIHTDEEFNCDICDRTFKTRTYMKTHRKSHFSTNDIIRQPVPPVPECHICGQKTKNISMLNKHLKIHNEDRPYKCDICGKGFTRGESLKDHHRSHTGERPFPCRICLKAFRYRTHLSRHILIHTGEKRHVCSVCHKAYSQSYGLTIHMRSHTGENPYICPKCSKCFRSRGAMTAHTKKCIMTDMEGFSPCSN